MYMKHVCVESEDVPHGGSNVHKFKATVQQEIIKFLQTKKG